MQLAVWLPYVSSELQTSLDVRPLQTLLLGVQSAVIIAVYILASRGLSL